MKAFRKLIYITLLLIIIPANGKSLEFNFNYFTFKNNNNISYTEYYISFLSTEINYKNQGNNLFQGSIRVKTLITRNDSIFQNDEYIFKTPLLVDTLNAHFFLDKQRIALPKGTYKLNMEFVDINSNNKFITYQKSINISLPNDSLCISDIMILDKYKQTTTTNILEKHGYDLTPIIPKGDYFFNESDTILSFYVEWYKTELDSLTRSGYLLNYYIEEEQSHKPISDFNTTKRKTTSHQNAHIGGFDISNLPSGNFNLVVAILNKKGLPVTKKRVFFQRKNTRKILKNINLNDDLKDSFVGKFTILEELCENISSLLPIATKSEWTYALNQLENKNLNQMQHFFYNFWSTRNPIKPGDEWERYYNTVKYTNKSFTSSDAKGFATDRGYVYLKYGAPNFIEKPVPENNSLPHEIWYYNKINNETNRLFVFTERVISSNDYKLIHSSLSNELQNPNWKQIVYR